ncbi:MAG: class I SAM-dependent methyltransferase [Candidatus Omnitrophota bacterium]
MSKSYTASFYDWQSGAARSSAEEMVPLIIDLVRPASVVDVGCGTGAWLSVFKRHGISDILGIDGSSVRRDMLEIPPDRFLAVDLDEPAGVNRTFDLVICLEVAEHITAARAERFIDFLVHLGPVVVFSAAIPFQGGTNHVNEQWPGYWCDLFSRKGYVAADCIRKSVWQNEKVDYWYAQNTLVFVKRESVDRFPGIKRCYENTDPRSLSVVHPRLYLKKVDRALSGPDLTELPVLKVIAALPALIFRSFFRKIMGIFRLIKGRR